MVGVNEFEVGKKKKKTAADKLKKKKKNSGYKSRFDVESLIDKKYVTGNTGRKNFLFCFLFL